jgi:CheY-like chemotaxis protein
VSPCPRCGGDALRELGTAGSSLHWYTCAACLFTWADNAPASEPLASHVAPKRILVVDDDPNVLKIIERSLPEYRVSLARDGQEALAIIRAQQIDLMITDYLMPAMNGQELVDTCEAEGLSFPMLVLTGYGHMLEREESAWWNSRPHLTKPIHLEALRATVARLLGGQ